MTTTLRDNVGGWRVSQCKEWWRVSLTNLIIHLICMEDFHRVVRSSAFKCHKNLDTWMFLFVGSLLCLSMSISYCSFSSYDFHSCDCTCVKCYSLGLSRTPIEYCKCKLPLKYFVGLDFVVRLRRVECQCLGRFKNTPYFFL